MIDTRNAPARSLSAVATAPPAPTPGGRLIARHGADREAVEGVLAAVGGTPCVRLRRLHCGRGLRVYAKLEACNPGGSMKDRPAKRMLADAIRDGRLRPGMTVVESSSGNMAVGLAQACAYHGLKFLCVADARTQPANIALVRAYGGDVEVVQSPGESGDFLTARLERVQEILTRHPDAFWPNQYGNPSNPESHAYGTAAELLRQSGGLDAVLVATSTTGTLNGTLDCVTRTSPRTRVVAVDSSGSVLFGGTRGPRSISGLGAGVESQLALGARPHLVERVTDADCVVGCRALVQTEAILGGGSSGGLVVALTRIAGSLDRNARVGLILPDHGSRYLETVYDDQWVERECGLTEHDVADRVRRVVARTRGEAA